LAGLELKSVMYRVVECRVFGIEFRVLREHDGEAASAVGFTK